MKSKIFLWIALIISIALVSLIVHFTGYVVNNNSNFSTNLGNGTTIYGNVSNTIVLTLTNNSLTATMNVSVNGATHKITLIAVTSTNVLLNVDGISSTFGATNSTNIVNGISITVVTSQVNSGVNPPTFVYLYIPYVQPSINPPSNTSQSSGAYCSQSYRISLNGYVFVGNQTRGHLLQLQNVYNDSGSYTNDYVQFYDNSSRLTYGQGSETPVSEGNLKLIIDGVQYNVSYGGLAGSQSNSWAMINQPQNKSLVLSCNLYTNLGFSCAPTPMIPIKSYLYLNNGIKGHLLQLIHIYNFSGYTNDHIQFLDVNTGKKYNSSISAPQGTPYNQDLDGISLLTLDGASYQFAYKGNGSNGWAQVIDGPFSLSCNPPSNVTFSTINLHSSDILHFDCTVNNYLGPDFRVGYSISSIPPSIVFADNRTGYPQFFPLSPISNNSYAGFFTLGWKNYPVLVNPDRANNSNSVITLNYSSDCNVSCVYGSCCTPQPTATTCGNNVCGVVTNNCGLSVNCGTCSSGFTCSAGQCISNKQGNSCYPSYPPFSNASKSCMNSGVIAENGSCINSNLDSVGTSCNSVNTKSCDASGACVGWGGTGCGVCPFGYNTFIGAYGEKQNYCKLNGNEGRHYSAGTWSLWTYSEATAYGQNAKEAYCGSVAGKQCFLGICFNYGTTNNVQWQMKP